MVDSNRSNRVDKAEIWVPAYGDFVVRKTTDRVLVQTDVAADAVTLVRHRPELGPLPREEDVEALCRKDSDGGLTLEDGWLRTSYTGENEDDDFQELLLIAFGRRAEDLPAGLPRLIDGIWTRDALILPVPASWVFGGPPDAGCLALGLRRRKDARAPSPGWFWEWRILSTPPRTTAPAIEGVSWVTVAERLGPVAQRISGAERGVRQLGLALGDGDWARCPKPINNGPKESWVPTFHFDARGTLLTLRPHAPTGTTRERELANARRHDVRIKPQRATLAVHRPDAAGSRAIKWRFSEGTTPDGEAPGEIALPLAVDGTAGDLAGVELWALPPENDPTATPDRPQIWIALDDGWLHLASGPDTALRWGGSNVVAETREVDLAPWIDGPAGAARRATLLLDNTVGVRATLSLRQDPAGGLGAGEGGGIDLYDAGLRVGSGARGCRGDDQPAPGLPPHPQGERPLEGDLTYLSPRLIRQNRVQLPNPAWRATDPKGAPRFLSAPSTSPLRATVDLKADRWQLEVDGLTVTWWRRPRAIPVIAPTEWAANDPTATTGLSALRGLVPHRLGGVSTIELSGGDGGAMRLLDDPSRAQTLPPALVAGARLIAARREAQGLELRAAEGPPDAAPPGQVWVDTRVRYAVPHLDENYRAATVDEDAPRTPTAATWVQARFADAGPVRRRLDGADALPLDLGDRAIGAAAIEIRRGHADRLVVSAGVTVLVERDAADSEVIRRWTLRSDDGAPTLCGLPLEPLRLSCSTGRWVLEALLGFTPSADEGGDLTRPLVALRFDGRGDLQPGPLAADGQAARIAVDQARLGPVGSGATRLVADAGRLDLADGAATLTLTALTAVFETPGGDVSISAPDQTMTLVHDGSVQLGGDGPLAHDAGIGLVATTSLRAFGILISERLGWPMSAGVQVTLGDDKTPVGGEDDPVDFDRIGDQIALSWARSADSPETSGTEGLPWAGLQVVDLTRLFMALERGADGKLQLRRAFVGWTGGALFGATPNEAQAPHLTFVQTDDARYVELNGTWHAEVPLGAHTDAVTIVAWDTRIELTADFEPTGAARLLLEHRLRDSAGTPTATWFAWQTGEISRAAGAEQPALDLSAIHALVPWTSDEHLGKSLVSHRPALQLVRGRGAPMQAGRLDAGEQVTWLGIPIRLGVDPPRATLEADALLAGRTLDPPLSPMRPTGAGSATGEPWYTAAEHAGWRSEPCDRGWSVGPLGRSTAAAEDPRRTATHLAFTLYSGALGADPAPRVFWVACDVIGLEHGGGGAAAPSAALRIFGPRGLEVLHRLDLGPAAGDRTKLKKQAETVLKWAGWRHQAVLDDGRRWTLVRSPLLTLADTVRAERVGTMPRAGSRDDRYAAAPGPIHLEGLGTARVPTVDVESVAAPKDRVKRPGAYAREALDQWHAPHLRVRLAGASGLGDRGDWPTRPARIVLSIDRSVPFAVDHSRSERPGRPRWGAPVPAGGAGDGDAYLASRAELDLETPRPGELMTFGITVSVPPAEGTPADATPVEAPIPNPEAIEVAPAVAPVDPGIRTGLARVFTARTPRSFDDQVPITETSARRLEPAVGAPEWSVKWSREHPEKVRLSAEAPVGLAVQQPGLRQVKVGEGLRIDWWALPEAGEKALWLALSGHSEKLNVEATDARLLTLEDVTYAELAGAAPAGGGLRSGTINLQFSERAPLEQAVIVTVALHRTDAATPTAGTDFNAAALANVDPSFQVVPAATRIVRLPPSQITVLRDQVVAAHGPAPSSGWIAALRQTAEAWAIIWKLDGEWREPATTGRPQWQVIAVGPDGSTSDAKIPTMPAS